MLDAYKELTPVIYGENGIKYILHDRKQNIYFNMHWHERMELLRVDSGQLELHLNNRCMILLPGQIAIICPYMLHAGFSIGEEPLTYHTIMFDLENFCNSTSAAGKYLLPIMKSEISFHPVSGHPKLLFTVDRLISYLQAPLTSNPLSAIGAVYDLLGDLYTLNLNTTPSTKEVSEQFRPILEYIGEHFTEAVSAKSISEAFGYNETYFCRRFKSITGITVMKYIQVLRMEAALRLLLEDPGDINSIAWKCGYADISYFSNCFRKCFGCSPSEFRKSKGKSVDKLPEVGYNFFRNTLTRS